MDDDNVIDPEAPSAANIKAPVPVTVAGGLPHQSAMLTLDGSQQVPFNERLFHFYRKYNKIMLDNVAIGKEKERLELENAQLEDLISQYISGTTLDTGTLAEDNPLFVVNGRTSLNQPPPVRKGGKIVTQDAALITTTAARQHAR